MPKYLSGRSKLRDHQRFTNDRFEYLSIEQAEPNLGNPPNGTPAIYGSANLPTGDRYQIVSIEGYPGERYWVPVEGGIIPGSLTIFDETDTDETYLEKIDDSNYLFNGNASVREINRSLDINLPDQFVTLSGLIHDLAKEIPKVGKVFYVGDIKLQIISRSINKINKVKLSI